MKQEKHTVLIVDDDADYRFLARRTFESLRTNLKVQLARNGDEAIAYLKGEGQFADRSKYEFPCYMLTDLSMTGGDGFEVLEFMKNHPELSVIPVVMMSDSDHPDDIRQAYILGASSFMVKPATMQGFKALLEKIHAYWAQCEVPQVDAQGYAVATSSVGRPGARYPKPKRQTTPSPRRSISVPVARRISASRDAEPLSNAPPPS